MRSFRGLRLTLWAVSVTALVACTAPPPQTGYRDQSTLIAATTRFDVQRFWGEWQVRAAFPNDADLREVALLPDQRGGLVWQVQRERCVNERCVLEQSDTPVRETGTGRLMLLDGSQREIWVLWVDADFRTAALGTPDGTFGMIVDRRTRGGQDRLAAAREVLDFNGYNLNQLQGVQ